MHTTASFKGGKTDNFSRLFFYFCSKHSLWVHVFEAALLSTHNLCFRAKIRKVYTTINPTLLYKSGSRRNINYMGGLT